MATPSKSKPPNRETGVETHTSNTESRPASYRERPAARNREDALNPHAGLAVAAMFVAAVFILSTRSKILLQFFVAHPDADLTDPGILPKLYDFALQHGPQLGDAGTVHAAATSWEISSIHPAALLAPATGTPSDRPRPVPQHPRRT